MIHQSSKHDSGHTHVTGKSIFVDDRLELADELHVGFVGSSIAYGKILNIFLNEAIKDKDCVGIYSAKDIPGHNLLPFVLKDQPFMTQEIVQFIGEPILVFASKTREGVARIQSKIKIDYDEYKAVFSIDEAKKNNLFIGPEKKHNKGDFEKAYKEAPLKLEGIFENGGQEHFYLEPQSSVVYPSENKMEIHSSTQHPTETQHAVAEILGLKFSDVTCVVKRLGGGFGGKEAQAMIYACMAALVAHKTQKPARIVLRTDEDMKVTGKRHAFKNHYKVGFTAEGRITALEYHLFANGGAYSDLSMPILERAMFHSDNAYEIPNMRVVGRVCKTNIPPNTAFRGFGGPQGMGTMENIIEEIAKKLGKDPLEVRELNFYKNGDITHYHQKIENFVLPELVKVLKTESDYKKRKSEIVEFNKKNPLYLRSLALTPIKFGISFTAKMLNQAASLVNVHIDGTVQISTGAVEMGQGVNTKIAQVAAHLFQIPVTDVYVTPTSTEKIPNTSPTAASSGADLNGNATKMACERILDRLKDFPKEMSFKEKVKQAYFSRISLAEQAYYATPLLSYDPVKGEGRAFLYYTQGAACSEVQIDRFTGETKVLRSDVLMDLGESLNPDMDLGQIRGAFIQGMGWVTNEELVYDEAGNLLSHSPTTYKVPHIADTPEIFNVKLFKNDQSHVSLFKSKAVGEPPFMLALSVWAAIKEVTKSPNLKIPATPEEILNHLEVYE